MLLLSAVRQGRYTLTERTKTIMEVREIHERTMLSAGLDILAEAASQNSALHCESHNSEANNNIETEVACQSIDPGNPGTSDVGRDRVNEKGSCDMFSNILASSSRNPQRDIPTPMADKKPCPEKIDYLGCGQRYRSLFNASIDMPRQCWPQILSNLVSAMTNLTPLQTKSKEEIQAILQEGQVCL